MKLSLPSGRGKVRVTFTDSGRNIEAHGDHGKKKKFENRN